MYEEQRRNKMQQLIAEGINPFGGYDVDEIRGTDFARLLNPDDLFNITCAGRLILLRVMGNLSFGTICDEKGKIQFGVKKKEVSEKVNKIVKLLDLGDQIVVTGKRGQTNTGEPTIWVTDINIGAKALSPPPAKIEGLQDIELRYRNRHTDLWSNPEVAQIMRMRSAAISAIRHMMEHFQYIEVETPVLQQVPGGANARPFQTHHNALDSDLFLRVAPELYLKRLLIGGMRRVFEIGKNFRNEGISHRHNPEFTAIEAYEAWGDYDSMMILTIELIRAAGKAIGLANDPMEAVRIVSYSELLQEHDCKTHEEYEKKIEPTLIKPTFVTNMPSVLYPLAKKSANPEFAEMFELVINGMEMGCGYTEQNDPDEQLKAFKVQADSEEVMDADFIEALKTGMPPAGGLGIGLDRLVAYLTGCDSIRDVILFPLYRKKG